MTTLSSLIKRLLGINKKTTKIESVEFKTKKTTKDGNDYEQEELWVNARPFKRLEHRCPVCGKKCPVYDQQHSTPSRWRAANLAGLPVYLAYNPVRVYCKEHGVKTENIPWEFSPTVRATKDFCNEVAWLCNQMSRTAIATYMNINWRTVGNCIQAAHNELEPDISNRLRGLKRICIDETSYTKGHNYITVVYDMDRNRVVYVAKGFGKEIFSKFCESLTPEERLNIEIVAGDGAKWIDQCVSEYFPNAKRAVDFFHVVEWINEALNELRKRVYGKAKKEFEELVKELKEREQAAKEEYKKARKIVAKSTDQQEDSNEDLEQAKSVIAQYENVYKNSDKPKKKGKKSLEDSLHMSEEEHEKFVTLNKLVEHTSNKYTFLKNPENLTENQDDIIKYIEVDQPDLYKAYKLKETIRNILHMKDPDNAKLCLDKWIEDTRESGLAKFNEIAEKIERHKVNILNAVTYQANSARSEATNTTIKVLIKMARGFRNIDNLISLVLLKCSDLVIPLSNRYVRDNETMKRIREQIRFRKEQKAMQGLSDISDILIC